MNPPYASPQPTNHSVSLQLLAQWLNANGADKFDHTDPRTLMADRYPHGLFSDAEVEALIGVFKP
ncbi:hypothetical protein [Pseudomonas typographi]|uniref:Uncharacterized protein n=1 Tax=Pseudomonas typographi TaxID=2715964 RepID=A0ABR7ZA11_9PSED|nr:hypothetical protein [Pseudomonas typographi]MBD1602401.1 hypothetical protein [Pseudomonas typographi]